MIFYKFHGNGNDFIIINNIDNNYDFSKSEISTLCDRRFGIGADGLILISRDKTSDFNMSYYNSDGQLGTMCGNGGRCVAGFAYWKGISNKSMEFRTSDGFHKAEILNYDKNGMWLVDLQLSNVYDIENNDGYYFLDTGSPHYVEFVNNVAEMDVISEGRKTRYSERFAPDGTNVNFVEIGDSRIFVRTYERGVENETLSCGTGVTASALATYLKTGNNDINIHTSGGKFKVRFEHIKIGESDEFKNIWLTGPVKFVFSGDINL